MAENEFEQQSRSDSVLAISVSNANKKYRGLKHPVLNGLDMTVEQGSIYGLLGPSGCGKTTLLKCIIDIGYMPQELAVYFNFRINELFFFYGKVNGMTTAEILKQTEFLSELLHLPEGERIIGTLSGGQKRLVSFGTAMVHDPKLMILDEPTVGVDPVISASIWQHLLYLSTNRGTTIIITTHYIEEARQANRVGLMRASKMLCEGEPEALIKENSKNYLEEVFLDLCRHETSQPDSFGGSQGRDIKAEQNSEPIASNDTPESRKDHQSGTNKSVPIKNNMYSWCSFNFTHLYACIFKEFILILRDAPALAFNFLIPALQLAVFLVGIGGNPSNLNIAIVNQDSAREDISLSVQFCDYLNKSNWGSLKHYGTFEAAKNAADDDKVEAIVLFKPNFTDSLLKKFQNPDELTFAEANKSKVYVALDDGSPINSDRIWNKINSAYSKLEESLYVQFVPNKALDSDGIEKTDPLYEDVGSFTDYAAPGTIMYLIFVVSCVFSSTRIIGERKLGLIERLSISGVTGSALIVSMLVVQSFILFIQVGIFLMTGLLLFGTPIEGNLWLTVTLASVQGFTGLIFGIFVSVICAEEAEVFQLVYGLATVVMLLSGILWPLEALPRFLKIISSVLPLAIPARAMRYVLLRGWDLTYGVIQLAFLINLGYFFGLLIITILLQKYLHRKG